MSHVISVQPEPLQINSTLRVHCVPAAEDNLVWLIECTETSTVFAVDGPGLTEVDAACERLGLTLNGVLTTHTHWDHIGLHKELAAAGRLEGLTVVGAEGVGVPGLNTPVDEGHTIAVGAHTATVWRTEGHMVGHLSYVFDGVVFTGDTLFAGGCGYLFQKDPVKMHRSLRRLATLPGHTLVCCAHEYTLDNLRFAGFVEPNNAALCARIQRDVATREAGGCTVPSTIELERATNPFLRPGSPTLRANVAELTKEPLLTLEAVFAATRELKNTGTHKTAPWPDGCQL